ncbi:MAG: hypothetical protein AMJ90_00665 [candidate division Zixibacteria bacterium SM23_73_2]|nr:MAG: hypothetical protein AMJ90_00665 [candidate division Zixibacteria bacterium SM23_73_2]
MKSIGIYLRSQRRLKGFRISKIADELKIKPEYIKAMENDRLDLLPTKAHQRVFLKSYAEFLGVDFEKIKGKFIDKGEGIKEKQDIYEVEPPKAGGSLLHLFLGLVLGFVIVGFFLKFAELEEFTFESEINPEVYGPFPVEEEITPVVPPFFPETEDGMLLRLEAFENSWLTVVGDGVNLFKGIIGKNTAMDFPAKNDFVIQMGRPEVLRGFVNGQILKPFHLNESSKRLELNTKNYKSFLDSTYIPKAEPEQKEDRVEE